MTRYRVIAPYVSYRSHDVASSAHFLVATHTRSVLPSGSVILEAYRGSWLVDTATPESIEHLLSVGMIEAVDVDDPVPAAGT